MKLLHSSLTRATILIASLAVLTSTPVGHHLLHLLVPHHSDHLISTAELNKIISANNELKKELEQASNQNSTQTTTQSLPILANGSASPSILNNTASSSTNPSAIERFKLTVKKGTTLASLWREIKGAPNALNSFINALSKKHLSLRAGEVVSVTRNGDRVIELRRELENGATLVVTGDGSETEGSQFTSRLEAATIHTRERKVHGSISTSLVEAARTIGVPYEVIDNFVDLFGNRVDFRKDLQPGDTFTIWFEERHLDTGRVLSTSAIKAASISINGAVLAVVRDVSRDGTVRYFDEKGEMPTKGFLRYPLKFTRISSMFTHARFHPVLKISRPHNGVDFAAPVGTPVRSVGDGRVVFAGWNSSGGNMIRIAHDSRYTTEYMHLLKIAPGIKTGASVARGAVIGALGSTGLSSGPHLHFGLFDKGRYIDPMKSKVIQATPEIRAPKGVYAIIAQLKDTHREIAVAALSVATKRGTRAS
jgi:murein DD-endopeptidase MepM/ murein hydrolase activator NlpD